MPEQRLLVVDDDAAARRMMRRALQRRGFEVEEADNGLDGVRRAEELLPDVVLLDLRMPGEMSGFDAARRLREIEATRAIPILVVSASVQADARQLSEQIGCDRFVEKPVDFDELYAAIDDVLAARG